MSEITIKVTPQELKECADDVSSLSEALRDDYDWFQDMVRKTANYWEGAAADKYRSDFAAQKEKTDEMLTHLSKFPEDLLTMAGIYEQAESTNTEDISELSTDFID